MFQRKPVDHSVIDEPEYREYAAYVSWYCGMYSVDSVRRFKEGFEDSFKEKQLAKEVEIVKSALSFPHHN